MSLKNEVVKTLGILFPIFDGASIMNPIPRYNYKPLEFYNIKLKGFTNDRNKNKSKV